MKTIITNENQKVNIETDLFNHFKNNAKNLWMMLVRIEGKPYMIDVQKTFYS